jgi:ribose-phosphate pyrophosphokinase
VRGRDVYVLQSLHGGPDLSPNDKLCRLLFVLATMRENGAQRVTAVLPYLAYARKDRQTKTRDPLTARYVAQLVEAVGTDAVVTLDVHNIVGFQNAHRCRTVHLDTRRLFATRAVELVGDAKVVVISPDPGGVKRAQLFRETLEEQLGRTVGTAYMEKRRSSGVVSGSYLVGNLAGATVLVIDDLISSGGTMVRAATACHEHLAERVYVFAAHGLFVGNASAALTDPSLAGLFTTDTVPPFRLSIAVDLNRHEVISAAPLFAEAIRRLHDPSAGTLSDLLDWPE